MNKRLNIELIKNLMEPHRMQEMNIHSKSANLGQLIDGYKLLKPIALKPIVLAIATMCLGLSVNVADAGERESIEQLRSTTFSLVNLLVQ